MRKWKTKLESHGFCLHPDNEHERLTNIRYADDILLFGKSLDEVVSMLELLVPIFAEYGLELNAQKTKVFNNEIASENTTYCITSFGTIEILSATQKHKYLGRTFTGEARTRGKTAVEHRISCGWMKYKAFENILQNKHISIRLRLKLFDAIVSSTTLYGLETCPMTETNQAQIRSENLAFTAAFWQRILNK